MKWRHFFIPFSILMGAIISSCNSSNPKKNDSDTRNKPEVIDTSKLNQCNKTFLLQVQTVPVYKFNNVDVVCFETGMKVDADGSPHAYNPQNTGLDDINNAGKNGYWWGIATKNDKPDGVPVIPVSYTHLTLPTIY